MDIAKECRLLSKVEELGLLVTAETSPFKDLIIAGAEIPLIPHHKSKILWKRNFECF